MCLLHRRRPYHRPARHPVGRCAGDRQPADAGQLTDRLLSRRVDIEHDRLVGQRQRRPELLGEGLRARVEVGLEDRDQALGAEPAQRRERGAHLGRVVGVVVVDVVPRPLPLQLKAPADPGEAGKRRCRRVEVERRPAPAGQRRAGVEHVVVAGDRARRGAPSGRGVAGRRTRPRRASPGGPAEPVEGAPCSSAIEPQREWWSISTLVITAISGFSSRKLPSLSSASATTHSPSPQPALAAARRRPGPEPRRRRRRRGRRRSPAAPRPASPSSSSCRGCRRRRSAASRRRARPAARRGGRLAPALARQRQLGVVLADRGRDDHLGSSGRLAASWPTPARGRRRAAAPYRRSRRGRCR